jgi:hypothetical protein
MFLLRGLAKNMAGYDESKHSFVDFFEQTLTDTWTLSQISTYAQQIKEKKIGEGWKRD